VIRDPFTPDKQDEASLFFDLSQDMLAVLTLDGRVLRSNSAWEGTLGASPENDREWTVLDLVHPDDLQMTIFKFNEVVKGADVVTFSNRCSSREGVYRWIEWTVTRSAQTKLIYVSARDVTDQIALEERLHRTNEILNAVLDAAPLAIWASDLEGDVQFWNPAGEHMLGWTEDEMLSGAGPRDFLPGMATATEDGRDLPGVEIRAARKDGSTIDVRLWTAPLRDLNGVQCGTLGMIEDITEEKRRDEQLRRAQKAEALSQLAGGISRDYSNLLTVIGGHTDLLIKNCHANHPHLRPLEGIRRAVQQASLVTSQLTAFSRRHVVQPQRVNLNRVVNEMSEGLERMLGEDCVLRTELGPKLRFVSADPSQLQQLVLNLLIGAREAMSGRGRITIETANEENTAGALPWVMLTVSFSSQEGGSLPENGLFEPFACGSGRGAAAGLALFTAREIVQLCSGEISVANEAGEAMFLVRLPAAWVASEPVSPSRSTQPKAHEDVTILVAEDDPMVRGLMREILVGAGYSVIEAADGAEALSMAARQSGPIDLLITDLVMPGMSGAQVYQSLRNRPEVSVLYVSGYPEDMIASEGLLEPGAAFLPKPFTPEALIDKVEQALEGNRGLRLLLRSGGLEQTLAHSLA
jgi:PAS domain S-box-containing protein